MNMILNMPCRENVDISSLLSSHFPRTNPGMHVEGAGHARSSCEASQDEEESQLSKAAACDTIVTGDV